MSGSDEAESGGAVSLEQINQPECLRLLSSASVGRIAFIVGGRPEVLPVNYVVDGESIVFRTAEGTLLNKVALKVVAFEVDDIDEATRSGWSVVVQGVAQDVSEAIDTKSERLRQLWLDTWAPGQRHRWFGINATRISGRRLHAGPQGR